MDLIFDNRSEKELIVIYVVIALFVSLGFTGYNISSFSAFPKDPYLIIFVANVLFFCMFYILYLPVKVRKAREKQEKKKSKK